MGKNSYHPPELKELGPLRTLVENNGAKTAAGTDGPGPGGTEIKPSGDVTQSDAFTRGSRSSSSESSGGRSGRN